MAFTATRRCGLRHPRWGGTSGRAGGERSLRPRTIGLLTMRAPRRSREPVGGRRRPPPACLEVTPHPGRPEVAPPGRSPPHLLSLTTKSNTSIFNPPVFIGFYTARHTALGSPNCVWASRILWTASVLNAALRFAELDVSREGGEGREGMACLTGTGFQRRVGNRPTIGKVGGGADRI